MVLYPFRWLDFSLLIVFGSENSKNKLWCVCLFFLNSIVNRLYLMNVTRLKICVQLVHQNQQRLVQQYWSYKTSCLKPGLYMLVPQVCTFYVGKNITQHLSLSTSFYKSSYCLSGASEPRNMAYMSRLGIWGEGTPFREFNDFIQAVERR